MFKTTDGVIQALGSAFILIGWYCASRGWIPLNYYSSAVGCGLWTVAGIIRSDWQIIILDSIVTALSLISVLTYFTNNGTLLPIQ